MLLIVLVTKIKFSVAWICMHKKYLMCQYMNVNIWRIRAYVSLSQFLLYVHAYHTDNNGKDIYIYIKISLAEYKYWYMELKQIIYFRVFAPLAKFENDIIFTPYIYCLIPTKTLIYRVRDKMDASLQTTFCRYFVEQKRSNFKWNFHWNMIPWYNAYFCVT